MLSIEVGKLYKVTMPGEPEFGGPMRVTKITVTTVTAVFEFDGKQDPPGLRFMRIGNHFRPETLRYKSTARRDAFPNGVVRFRLLKNGVKKGAGHAR